MEDIQVSVLGGERRTRWSWGFLPALGVTELLGNRERAGLVGRGGQCRKVTVVCV